MTQNNNNIYIANNTKVDFSSQFHRHDLSTMKGCFLLSFSYLILKTNKGGGGGK